MYRLSFKPILWGLAATLAVAGCTPGGTVKPSAGQNPAQQAPGPSYTPGEAVTLALLSPVSSPRQGAAQLGEALVNAARMGAVDTGNRKIALKVYDTAGDPATAARVAEQAIQEGADIILGPLFSTSTKAVAPIAAREGIKVMSFSTDSSAAGGQIWLTGFLPEMEARRVLSYARSQGKGQVGVLYPETPYGAAALRGAQNAQRSGLTQIIGTSSFQPGFNGVKQGVDSFAQTGRGANAVLIAAGGPDLQAAGSFLDFRDFNPRRVKFLGLGQWFSGATLKEKTLRGGWFPAPDVAKSTAFSDKYASRFGSKPRLVTVLGYDAVVIAEQVFDRAVASASVDPFPTDILTRPSGFTGALGPVRFLPDGLSERSLAILSVGSRRFDTIDPAPAAFGAGS